MEVRCTVCGAVQHVEKWQEEYEKLRERQDQTEPYICEACQERIRRDALKETH
jgi:uncharacterized protein YlaI